MASAMVMAGGLSYLSSSSLLEVGEMADGVVTDPIQVTTQIPHYREDSTHRTSLENLMESTMDCVMAFTLRTQL